MVKERRMCLFEVVTNKGSVKSIFHRYSKHFPPSFQHPQVTTISAKIIVSRFDRRMAFVPEGQADRSQARNAWVARQRGPVPEGQADRSQARSAWVSDAE